MSALFSPARLAGLLVASGLAAAAAPAHAAGELALHLSSQQASDPDYQMFSATNELGSYGLRGGWHFHDHLGVVADVHRTRRGGDVYAVTDESDETFAFRTGLTVHQLALGLKSRWELGRPSLALYGLAQGMLLTSTSRFDDQPDEDGNPNELQYRAVAPGVRAALGMEWLPIRLGFEDRLFTHVEAGYGYVGALNYKDTEVDGEPTTIGDLRFRGLYISWGVGWRF